MKLEDWLPQALTEHRLWRDTDWQQGRRFEVPSGANLREANLSGANLRWANLSGANLCWANLRWANLREANLSDANLRWANLRWADLSGANLSGANLSGANLSGANLSGADLSGANLRGANLSGADLSGADLSGANLREAIGNTRELLSIQTKGYSVVYTAEIIQIGCKNHTIAQWEAFTNAEIAAMDAGALDWWRTHKPLIMGLIAANPATPTNPHCAGILSAKK